MSKVFEALALKWVIRTCTPYGYIVEHLFEERPAILCLTRREAEELVRELTESEDE